MFFDDLDLAPNKRSKVKTKGPFVPKVLTFPAIINRPYVEFTDRELWEARGGTMVFDIECYWNYFLIAFKDIATNKVVTFELSPDCPQFSQADLNKLNWVVHSFRHISFNGIKFDRFLLFLALAGAPMNVLKYVTNRLINDNKRPVKGDADYGLETKDRKSYRKEDIEKEFNIRIPEFNHVDLIEVAPLQASLKTYAGRLHAPRMQDLPYEPETILTREQAVNVRFYCVNDLDNTALLFKDLEPQIKLREQLSTEYGQDLRSLSDAQIAEHVLSAECEKLNGYYARKPKIAPGTEYYYVPPAFVHFQTPMLQQILQRLVDSPFVISEKGRPKSSFLKGLKIRIGDSVYTMGVGGLHSTENCAAHYARDGYLLIDRDVASYYPNIIINNGYFPKHLGPAFLTVYKTIVARRLEAKGLSKSSDLSVAELNQIIADSLKITINGSFGKLGSKYSALYSPDLLIQTTLTGQLSLLMLIEMLELVGIKVISANTDGIVIKPHESQYEQLNEIIAAWEKLTGFETEETQYKGVFSRDVNNYIALKKHYDKASKSWVDTFPEGTKFDKLYKGKGVFGETTLKKQPTNEICAKAIAHFLIEGKTIAETVNGCRDIKDFVTVKNVKGGAEKDGLFLGKAIRWYYAKGVTGTINYIMNGNTVGNSEGACPIMDLPDAFPADMDFEQYTNMAEDMLSDMGYYGPKKAKRPDLFEDLEGSGEGW
ncbi:DNA polymerase subunit [Escherichia phage Halfdan]|uniref:DNA polymerase subunit n=1 Tax=Escherichia phage Halfdan TaxID=2234092 RepID=A0A2Z5H3F7_9CAUD|nr:DNA polymerase subunit [Escherichia phage Halfdan]AXC34310.1 DNA polymerase subunit [Escherichia phage Halfdan]